jgi:hypothetical protein
VEGNIVWEFAGLKTQAIIITKIANKKVIGGDVLSQKRVVLGMGKPRRGTFSPDDGFDGHFGYF